MMLLSGRTLDRTVFTGGWNDMVDAIHQLVIGRCLEVLSQNFQFSSSESQASLTEARAGNRPLSN